MLNRAGVFAFVGLFASLAVGCASADPPKERTRQTRQPFASVEATQLDFELDASLVTDNPWAAESEIQNQLRYAVGTLNAESSVLRFEQLALSSIVKTDNGD